MSDATTAESQELLIAKSPTGVHIIMGLRGATARDLVGEMDAAIGWMPRWLMADLSGARPGLHVCSFTVKDEGQTPLKAVVAKSTIRPAVIGDFHRFGLPTPNPRCDENGYSQ